MQKGRHLAPFFYLNCPILACILENIGYHLAMSENRNNAYTIRNSSLKIAAQLSAVFEKQMSAVEGSQFHLESVQGIAETIKLLMETASISQKLLISGDQKLE